MSKKFEDMSFLEKRQTIYETKLAAESVFDNNKGQGATVPDVVRLLVFIIDCAMVGILGVSIIMFAIGNAVRGGIQLGVALGFIILSTIVTDLLDHQLFSMFRYFKAHIFSHILVGAIFAVPTFLLGTIISLLI